jgi:hypothetical protein
MKYDGYKLMKKNQEQPNPLKQGHFDLLKFVHVIKKFPALIERDDHHLVPKSSLLYCIQSQLNALRIIKCRFSNINLLIILPPTRRSSKLCSHEILAKTVYM